MGSKHWGPKRLTLGPFSWDVTRRGHPGSASEPHDRVHPWIKWENYLHDSSCTCTFTSGKGNGCTVGIRWYWTVAVLPPKAPSTRTIDPFQGGSRRLKCFSNTMCNILNPANCRYLQSPAAGAAASAPASAVGVAWTFNMSDAFHILVLKLFLWWLSLSLSVSRKIYTYIILYTMI